MKIAIIILLVAVAILAVLFVIGASVADSAQEEFYREFGDRDQEEYLHRWREKQKEKKQLMEKKVMMLI